MNISVSRRAITLAALLTIPLAACGSGSGGGDETSPTDGSADSSSDSASAAYPRTVRTSRGPVTIKSAPKRIVVLGAQPAEAVLALGATPVAIDTYGAPYSPWLKDKVGSAEHQKLSDAKSVKIEAVAADKPDLIIVSNWLMQLPGAAEKLRALAPTVDVPEKTVNADWDKVISSTADALGKPAAGTKLISSLKKRMSEAGESVPAGSTYNWVRLDADGWGYGNGSLLDSFGLKPGAGQDNTNSKVISTERTDELTGDLLLVWAYGKTAEDVVAEPGAKQLPAARKGTLKIVDLNFANAVNSAGAYSIPWLVNEIQPELDKLAK
jgi:iron complex transport system substrate-binding protein